MKNKTISYPGVDPVFKAVFEDYVCPHCGGKL